MRNLYYHIHFSPNVHSARARGMYLASKKDLFNFHFEYLGGLLKVLNVSKFTFNVSESFEFIQILQVSYSLNK